MHPLPPTSARRGLTFIELMFSTVILGVGMIMIAAIFPVAINEQRAMVDESTVSNLERGAVRSLQSIVSNRSSPTSQLPETLTGAVGAPVLKVVPMTGPTAVSEYDTRVRGDQINKADGRYAWAALYARAERNIPAGGNPASDAVTFFVVSMVNREAATFLDIDDTAQGNKLKSLQPKGVKITYHFKDSSTPTSVSGLVNPIESDVIEVEEVESNAGSAAVEGGFVIRGQIKLTVDGTGNLQYPSTYPQNMVIKLGAEFTDDDLTSKPTNKPVDMKHRYFRVADGYTMLNDDVTKPAAQMNGTPAWVVGADPTLDAKGDQANAANRAIACRAVTVRLKTPGD